MRAAPDLDGVASVAPVTFDADAYAAALQPRTLRLNGRTYVARELSIEEQVRLSAELTACQARAKADPRVAAWLIGAFVRRLARRLFPHPWWCVWRPSVAAQLRHASGAMLLQFLQDFSPALTPAAGPAMSDAPAPVLAPPPAGSGSGTSSPGSSPRTAPTPTTAPAAGARMMA